MPGAPRISIVVTALAAGGLLACPAPPNATSRLPAQASASASTPRPPVGRIDGVAWVGAGPDAPEHLPEAFAIGARWIAQTPFGWMRGPRDPAVRLATDGRILWGESDAGLAATHRRARELGLATALKPHIWIRGSWPGEVAMASDEEWAAWFADYGAFMLHYAELAEREGMEMLAVGTELRMATATRESDWRELIGRVRQRYHGRLTYAANWDEMEHVPFWDAVDLIGVNAYFPLSPTAGDDAPTVAALVAAWAPWRARLEALAARHGKRILFTEAGYRPVARCHERPWEQEGGEPSDDCQARAWEALLHANGREPWFAGVFVWKWFPVEQDVPSRATFSPQGRPAERILGAWFRGEPGDAATAP